MMSPTSEIGTFETCQPAQKLSAYGGNRKSSAHDQNDAIDPERTRKSRWTSHYPALASRLSMRLRSASKSIGLVSSASAPRSKAFRSVSASP